MFRDREYSGGCQVLWGRRYGNYLFHGDRASVWEDDSGFTRPHGQPLDTLAALPLVPGKEPSPWAEKPRQSGDLTPSESASAVEERNMDEK